ncbi:hypothetical protein Save01_08967 [Streptomyces avermitilis]
MGGGGAGRYRSVVAARQLHRSVRRRRPAGLPRGADGLGRGRRRLRHDRCARQRDVGPGVVRAGPGGSRGDGGHGVLVLAGRPAPSRSVPEQRRVRAGPGRRCDHHGHAGRVRGVRHLGRYGGRRPLQGLRGIRGRHRLGRGRRHGGRRAALGRAPQRSRSARRHPWQRDQPGRRVERSERAERAFAAAGDPAGAGERRSVGRRRGHGGGARYGDDAGRPDRGPGAAGHLWAGPSGRPAAVARLREVQLRAHGCRGRRGGRHQGRTGPAQRPVAEDAACGRADAAGGLVGGCGGAVDAGAGVAGCGASAPGGCVVVRDQWHERARDSGAGAGAGGCGGAGVRGGAGGGGASGVERAGAVAGVGAYRGGVAGSGGTAGRAPGRASRGGPAGCGLLAGDDASEPGTPCGGTRQHLGGTHARAERRRRSRHLPGRDPWQRHGHRCGVRVPGSGVAVGGDGAGFVGCLAGVRRVDGGV